MNIRISVLPKSTLGRWSVGLTISLILFFVLFQLLVASGQRGGEKFFDNLALTIPILTAGICGVSAFITGIMAIIKSKERSVLVFLTTTIGFFVLVFWLGEFVLPH